MTATAWSMVIERTPYDVTNENIDAAAWDDFVGRTAHSTFAHLHAWRTVLHDALGHETVHFVARTRDGECAGVLPVTWVRHPLVGRYLMSMPFLDSGGPVGDQSARTALSLAAAEEARRGGADLLELRARESCSALAVTHRKLTVRLALPDSDSALWTGFSSKLRSQIKRPQGAGCTTRFGATERDAFHSIYARHLRDLGSPAQGRGLFDALARSFPGIVDFAVVYDRAGEPVAGGCGFAWRGEFALVWAASLRSANRIAPNMLLYWSFMQRCIERGITTFDFGRCTSGSGTHRFKQQWGGVDVDLPWMQWSSRGVTAPPNASRPHFALASAVWRRLPHAVTRVCGPALARLIP